jgi:hypothetical protein
VAIRTLGNLYLLTVIGGNSVMRQFLVTGTASHGADAHATYFAFIQSHYFSSGNCLLNILVIYSIIEELASLTK